MAGQPGAILTNSGHVDLSTRVKASSSIVASPTGATEVTIATLTISNNLQVATGIDLLGWAAFTVGTNGVSVNLKLRQTGTSGTTVAATGATTATAANLGALSVAGLDTSPVLPGQVYVLTMTVASASATSTVSAVYLRAIIV